MSQVASQSAAFRVDVVRNGVVWTVESDDGPLASTRPAIGDGGGLPQALSHQGRTAMPFWSSRSRVERTIKRWEALAGMRPRQLLLEDFEMQWLPRLDREGLLCGVNWSGPRASGIDVEPREVKAWLDAIRIALKHSAAPPIH